jgi:hypothetical protein
MHIVTVQLSYCKLSSFILLARLLQLNAHDLNHQASFVYHVLPIHSHKQMCSIVDSTTLQFRVSTFAQSVEETKNCAR